MTSAYSYIFSQIKVIFIRMVSNLDSLWNRGASELETGLFSLRAGLLVGIVGKGAGEKNGARKSEPARELLIFEFPAFADERSDLIG